MLPSRSGKLMIGPSNYKGANWKWSCCFQVGQVDYFNSDWSSYLIRGYSDPRVRYIKNTIVIIMAGETPTLSTSRCSLFNGSERMMEMSQKLPVNFTSIENVYVIGTRSTVNWRVTTLERKQSDAGSAGVGGILFQLHDLDKFVFEFLEDERRV